MLKITLNEIIENKKNIIEKIKEEAKSYLNNKDYTETLNIYISCEVFDTPFDEEINAMEYLTLAFSVYNKVIEEIPEILLFLKEITFFEIMFAYKLFAKSNPLEILNFSVEIARERGIKEEAITTRYNELIKLI